MVNGAEAGREGTVRSMMRGLGLLLAAAAVAGAATTAQVPSAAADERPPNLCTERVQRRDVPWDNTSKKVIEWVVFDADGGVISYGKAPTWAIAWKRSQAHMVRNGTCPIFRHPDLVLEA